MDEISLEQLLVSYKIGRISLNEIKLFIKIKEEDKDEERKRLIKEIDDLQCDPSYKHEVHCTCLGYLKDKLENNYKE